MFKKTTEDYASNQISNQVLIGFFAKLNIWSATCEVRHNVWHVKSEIVTYEEWDSDMWRVR